MILLVALACERPPLACDERQGPDAPSDLAEVLVTSVDPDRSVVASGFLLLNTWSETSSHAVAIDGCGTPWWWSAASSPDVKVTRVRLSRDHTRVLYQELSRDVGIDRTGIVDVALADGATSTTRTPSGHHDFVELQDGRLAWLAWQFAPRSALASDQLVVQQAQTREPEVLYSFLDDSEHEPFWSCDHMKRGTYLPGHEEWTHTNSLAVDDASGAFFLAVRYWDAVLRVEADGTLGWELGGPGSDLGLGPYTTLPRHGHSSELAPDRMLFFDNGNHDGDDPKSRVVEYRIDSGARRVDETWSWETGGYTDYLGDARSLPGGHVLVARPGGTLVEVTREGDIVWEAEVDAKIGRVEFVADWPQ